MKRTVSVFVAHYITVCSSAVLLILAGLYLFQYPSFAKLYGFKKPQATLLSRSEPGGFFNFALTENTAIEMGSKQIPGYEMWRSLASDESIGIAGHVIHAQNGTWIFCLRKNCSVTNYVAINTENHQLTCFSF